MKNRIISLTIFLCFLLLGLNQAYAQGESYHLAQDAVKSNNREFALIYFLSELRDNPQSKRRQEALFACAEYYFLAKDYVDSFNTLKEFIDDYPHSKMLPFALLYLAKISQAWGRDELAKSIEKRIINLKRVILLFKENKECEFRSPLGVNHKLIYYIDKLEFYSDGQIQAQILY